MPPNTFYDGMAEHYHLIFEDWNRSIARQGRILAALLPPPEQCGIVLDCACGIGTQSIGLALEGFQVEGSDLSDAAVRRAAAEARARGLSINFRQDDMRYLERSPEDHFGCVLALDNSVPHLDSDQDILTALRAMHSRLRPGGSLMLSVRDYSRHLAGRTTFTEPAMFDDGGLRRIVHQVWDWKDERRYTVHIFITQERPTGQWSDHHFVGEYRAITTDELSALTRKAGFQNVRVDDAAETGFYQPLVRAEKRQH